MKTSEQSLRDLWDTVKNINTCDEEGRKSILRNYGRKLPKFDEKH